MPRSFLEALGGAATRTGDQLLPYLEGKRREEQTQKRFDTRQSELIRQFEKRQGRLMDEMAAVQKRSDRTFNLDRDRLNLAYLKQQQPSGVFDRPSALDQSLINLRGAQEEKARRVGATPPKSVFTAPQELDQRRKDILGRGGAYALGHGFSLDSEGRSLPIRNLSDLQYAGQQGIDRTIGGTTEFAPDFNWVNNMFGIPTTPDPDSTLFKLAQQYQNLPETIRQERSGGQMKSVRSMSDAELDEEISRRQGR